MIRFLHTSDWQLGMTRHFFSEGIQERFAQSRFDAIREVGRIAEEEDCRPMQDLVALTTEKLEPIVDTRYVCVAHGRVDNLSPNPNDPAADISKIEATIDQLIYKLYDLTPDEIAIVEGK